MCGVSIIYSFITIIILYSYNGGRSVDDFIKFINEKTGMYNIYYIAAVPLS